MLIGERGERGKAPGCTPVGVATDTLGREKCQRAFALAGVATDFGEKGKAPGRTLVGVATDTLGREKCQRVFALKGVATDSGGRERSASVYAGRRGHWLCGKRKNARVLLF